MGGRIWKPIIPVTISCHWSGGSCALSGLGRSPELFLPSRLTPSGPARPSTEPAADRLPHIPQTQPSTRACSPTYNTRLVVAIFFTSVSAGSRRSARPLSVALPLRSASGRRDCRLRPFPPTAASRNPEECGADAPVLVVLEETSLGPISRGIIGSYGPLPTHYRPGCPATCFWPVRKLRMVFTF